MRDLQHRPDVTLALYDERSDRRATAASRLNVKVFKHLDDALAWSAGGADRFHSARHQGQICGPRLCVRSASLPRSRHVDFTIFRCGWKTAASANLLLQWAVRQITAMVAVSGLPGW